MKKLMLLTFLITSLNFFGQVQIGNTIYSEASEGGADASVSLSSDGTIVAIGGEDYDGINGEDSGRVRVFENINGLWTQIGIDIEGKTFLEHTGDYVDLSDNGSIVAIGSRRNVRIYKNANGNWSQIGQDIVNEDVSVSFGRYLSISGDGNIVAVGAASNDNLNGVSTGQVRIYQNINDQWIKLGDYIDGEEAGDGNGRDVSLSKDGSIVAIGSYRNDGVNGEDSGHVRVFEYMNSQWNQIGDAIDGEAAEDLSGIALKISNDGDIVAIGAMRNHGVNGEKSGHVRVYKNLNGVWIQIGDDIDGEEAYDQSGFGLNMSGDGSIVVIGARINGYGSNNFGDPIVGPGHVRIYKNIDGVWTKVGNDIDGESEFDLIGSETFGLSEDGSIVAIGGFTESGRDNRHVKVFNLSSALELSQFSLPSNNFLISITSESCASMNNGSILISTEESHDYTATLVGGTINESKVFNTETNFQTLEAGTYELCFTIADQANYQKCFTVQITEPDNLDVDSKIDDSAKTVSLSLKGGSIYFVSINGNEYSTSKDYISLPLTKTVNTVQIKTDKACQGIYEEFILVSNQKTFVYPNPINLGELSVILPSDTINQEVLYTIFSQSGIRVLEKMVKPTESIIKINMQGLQTGMYTIVVTTETQNIIHKIIKK